MLRIALAALGVLLLGVLSTPFISPFKPPAGKPTNSAQATPVLVELFTSEGCSDCPPADSLLETLDRSQPIVSANIVVLSEHVDYWDDIGWRDPYSSHENTERQGAYAAQFRLQSVYTPQMVVDGHIELVGSDGPRAVAAIQNAAKTEKVPVTLSAVHFEGTNTVALHIEVAASASNLREQSMKIIVAVADDSDESHVTRGENAGRSLRHIAVVRTLVQVGSLEKGSSFSKDTKVHVNSGNSRDLRLVAFAQDQSGRVWGVGSARLSN